MRRLSIALLLLSTCLGQQKETPRVAPSGAGPRYDLMFGTAVMKVTREQTGGKWAMVDFTGNPGMQTVYHRHRKTDETFFVLEGELTMSIEGKMHTLHHGDMALVPRMTPHAIGNLSDKPVRFLGTFTPSGFEDFFPLVEQAVKKDPPGSPGFAAAMEAINKKVDMETLGPPPFGRPGPAGH